ncbi:hypothetical protein CHS0354_013375 [Potamilus streckersoni]|uniref:Uncharacterized protein n=1 Tax=Potamilus streckersoni TaxID=2493646 RepID=A0AAE0RVU6_9BIVA|nr:hypothetical protein CHS0354_013375 [Potamilus streckersoni]
MVMLRIGDDHCKIVLMYFKSMKQFPGKVIYSFIKDKTLEKKKLIMIKILNIFSELYHYKKFRKFETTLSEQKTSKRTQIVTICFDEYVYVVMNIRMYNVANNSDSL